MIDEEKLIEELNDLMDANLLFYDDASKSRQETLEEIVDLILDQPKVDEWISVEDRLPNEEEFEKYYRRNHYAAEFIVMIKGASKPTTLYYTEGIWFDDNSNDYDVIAWQPLPEPYEVKEYD